MRIHALSSRVFAFLVAGSFAVAVLAIPVSFDLGDGSLALKAASAGQGQPSAGQNGPPGGQKGGGGGGGGQKGGSGPEGNSGP